MMNSKKKKKRKESQICLFSPPDTPYHLDHKIEQNICYFCFIVTKQFIKQFVSHQGYTEWTNQHPELLSIYKRKKMSIAVIHAGMKRFTDHRGGKVE